MRVIISLLTIIVASSAFADHVVMLPHGGTCMVNSSGIAYGCSEPETPETPAQTAAREASNAARLRSEKLEKCLRTADWPNQPNKDDCIRMYGN